MGWTHTGSLTFLGNVSQAITTNGKSLTSGIAVDNPSTALDLLDAFTTTGSIQINRGTFTTNNYAVTAATLSSSNSNTRTINLGSSTVTLSGATPINLFAPGLTFSAGTSQINCSNTAPTFAGGGQTFYNVSFTSTAITTISLSFSNTFNNLSVTGPASTGVIQVTFAAPQTINGTLSTTGTAGNRRVWFRGATYGIAQTLTINSAPSLTDADFRDIYVIGTAAPISGTRIGDLRGIRGITASTPKNCYRIGTGNWSDNQWSDTSGGSPNTDFFPLAQDTAVFDQSTTGGTHTMNTVIPYTGSVDMSARTSALTLSLGVAQDIYGNWTFGSGITISGNFALSFSGRDTQTITSAGKTFSGGITVDSYGGAVELADALNIGTRTLIVTNGTFDTKNYNVTAGILSSSNSNVRAINLGSSTVTLSSASAAMSMNNGLNLVFNPGTSSIVLTGTSSSTPLEVGGVPQLYDVTFTRTTAYSVFVNGAPTTIRNLTITAPASAGITEIKFSSDFVVTGTLTCTGATAVRRIFLRSSAIGTTRTLTVNSLSADDCDFRDITIAGAAAGSSPTRAGDCGGNTGITFPAAKTVYWNLSSTSTWFGNGWCPTSGGTPDVNSFPLAQDTAVFNDAGAATTVNPNVTCNIGTIDMSARTTAITSQFGACTIYGNVTLTSALTINASGTGPTFSGRGTQTITSAGVTFNNPITIDSFSGTVQLADALTLGSTRTLTLTSGTFDAVTYNVTTGLFSSQGGTLSMGSGTWTLSGTGTVWAISVVPVFFKGTANIVLSDTSATARTFSGGGLSYNKLTIGGATGSSNTAISGASNQFTEFASTKTVAHTMTLSSVTLGAWTVTGTAGNVVTLAGTASITISGAAVSGVDYLAFGTTTVSATSPGEFYAGANSTATSATAPLYLTAKPADAVRYWVNGTGNWSSTAQWSASSGGASGASVPRSHDDVVFNSASNATGYTATINAVTGGVRCKSLTITGPASGSLTLAGTTAIVGIHDNVSLPATGFVVSYSGILTLSGSTTGKTFTTNGAGLSSSINVDGVGCGWALGSALSSTGTTLAVINGTFDTGSYNATLGAITSSNRNSRTVTFGSGTITLSGNTVINFGNSNQTSANLTFNAGTSTISCSGASPTIVAFNPSNFYNLSLTSTALGTASIFTPGTFNDVTVAGRASSGIGSLSIEFFGLTLAGTLTLSAGTDATCRTFVRSNVLGTTRTLTCANFVGTDVDFRDITIAGAAAPVSGTRLGDCKGNSGITFDAAKTVYYAFPFSSNWGDGLWALTAGGTASSAAFPLAQDTAVFPISPTVRPASGATVTINAAYNIGTIDMSARTSNTMTLTVSSNITLYGNWINGTGTSVTSSSFVTFSGRATQTLTSAGKTFPQFFTINSPNGSVVLQDAWTISSAGAAAALTITAGTLDANGYNVTLSGASTQGGISSSNSNIRTIAIGSGTWTISNSGGWNVATSTNLTVTGTGTISLTSASAKTFAGGGISYSGITLDQGGAGTLTITGNNTFANISNTYSATGATTIAMGTTTQTVGNFTASGEAGRVLTVQGTSASNPATLIFSGSGQATQPTTDYLTITGVRAYSLDTTWYAGNNSTNNGSLGWYFEAGGGGPISVFIIESATSADAQSNTANITVSMSETTTASDAAAAGLIYIGTLNESATAADVAEAFRAFLAGVSESATSSDLLSAALTLSSAISELTTATDSAAVTSRVTNPTIAEAAQMADALSGGLLFLSNISEATTASEIAESVLIFNRAVAEATTASEVLAAVAVFQAAVPEQVSGADVANALLTVGGAINEALTVLDSAVGPKTTRPSIAESATGSDSTTNVYTANPVIAETAIPLDAAQVVASTFNAASAETAIPLDTPQGANTGSSSLSESAVVSETQAAQFTAVTAVSEASTAQESVSSLAVFRGPIVEAASPADTASVAPSVFSAVALAAAQAAESFNPAGSIYNAVLPIQGAGITDSLIGAYLWNPIDDNQTPNWQNVVNSQGSGWVQINTDDAPNWQPTIEP